MIEMVTAKRSAVVVGVDSYIHQIDSLHTSVADAQAIASLLEATEKFTVRLLLNEQATKEQLLEELKWLFPSSSSKVSDSGIPELSLLYFSGYGAGLTGYTGATGEAYQGDLVTHDFDPESPGNTGLALNLLSELVSSSLVQQQVIWLDSDYSGRFIELIKEYSRDKDCCFIAASASNEPAYEDVKHGVFTNALLQSLDPTQQSDKQVTSQILAEWFRTRSSELKSNRYSSLQHPVVFISGSPILFLQSSSVLSDLDPYLEIASASVKSTVDRMASLAASAVKPVTITTSFLLFAIVDQGKTSSESNSAKFLEQFLAQVPNFRYEKYWQRKGVSTSTTSQSLTSTRASQYITVNVLNCFLRAKQKAKDVGDEQIHIRHLLATLLEDWPKGEKIGAQTRLEEMGVELPTLREAYFKFLQPALTGSSADFWSQRLLLKKSTPTNVRHLSGYSADVTRDKDLIGIDQDVKAFATLIAAQSVVPPLSIGLFGKWGSGKSFFMRQLRKAIADLAIEAQNSEKSQRELPFYKRIVQIEFNAWQYVEGNLWASLVEHIFENLQVVGETTVSEKLRENLITELRSREKLKEQAGTALKAAETEARKKARELDVAKAKLEDKIEELTAKTLQQDVRNFLLPYVQISVNNLLAAINLQPVGESARELGNALNQAQNVLQQGIPVLTPLFYARDRQRRWIVLLLRLAAVPLIGWLLGMIPSLLGAETIAQLIRLAGGISTFLLMGTQWIKEQTRWLNSQLGEFAKVQRQYEQQLEAELAKNIRDIKRLEQDLSLQQSNVQNAQQLMEEADRQVAEMQAAVDRATPANLLADFIQNRVASDDYRRHLGLLALIHNDFKQLSELMEEENWRLAPSHPDDSQVRWKNLKYKDLDDEASSKNTRINRIVLYIDDLDRCPPNKVVDVLQAIHLLLAFPLFVVVVGVDARWITRSLVTRYRRLLNGSNDLPQDITNLIGEATPHDYLEKIFQIPFWLKPMDESACQKMVKGLLEGQVKSNERSDPSTLPPDNISRQFPKPQVTDKDDSKPISPSSGRGELLEETQPASSIQQPVSEVPKVNPDLKTVPEPDHPKTSTFAQAESLLIDLLELQFIETDLAPLLGRSPRALKRFINVYRLIKAQYEQKVVESEGHMSDYQAVLFLLAMDTGTPDIAPAFFRLLLQSGDQNEANNSDGSPVHNLDWLLQQLESDSSVREQTDWDRLGTWLRSSKARQIMGNDISLLFKWAERVVRYSFHGSFERS